MIKNDKITLEQLAREIHISRTTIYKILNNKGKVSEETRKKVLDAVERYRYVPNLAAKNLALNRQYHIAFVGYSNPKAPYTLNSLLKGARWAADEYADYGLKLSCASTETGSSAEQVQTLMRLADEGADAFAVYPERIVPMRSCIEELTRAGKLVCTVSKDVPGSGRQAYVGSNYYRSGMLAAEVLARMVPPGREVAVLLGGRSEEHLDVIQRYEGLQKKMERFPSLKLLPPYIDRGDGDQELEEYLKRLLSSRTPPGGILDITCDLNLAGQIVDAYQNTVRLVGFDLCESVRRLMISHSIDAVIFQDTVSQGYQAVKLLFNALLNPAEAQFSVSSSKLEVVYEGNLEFYITSD
jgi:LacI family transcriptional regulator